MLISIRVKLEPPWVMVIVIMPRTLPFFSTWWKDPDPTLLPSVKKISLGDVTPSQLRGWDCLLHSSLGHYE